MSTYFNITDFRVAEFDRAEPRFVEQIPDMPAELADGAEWRRLSGTNLAWLEKTLQIAMTKLAEGEERLGMASLFYFHLRALSEGGPEEDLRPDLFGQLKTDDFET